MRVLSIGTEYEEYYSWEDCPTTLRTANVRYVVDVEHVVGGHLFKSEVEVPASKYGSRKVTVGNMEDYLRGLLTVGEEIGVVKKEQLYKVEVPDPESRQKQTRKALYRRAGDGAIVISTAGNNSWGSSDCKLTEEEIKRNHEYLWQFAEPVEEPKFIVPLKGLSRDGRQVFLIKDAVYRSDNLDWSKERYLHDNVDDYALTEEEIKNIDWAYWEFAIPVEEWVVDNA